MNKLTTIILIILLPLISLSQSLTSISPNSGNAGQTLNLTITGNATHFDQGSGTLLDFGFNQGSGTTVINSISASSPTTIVANITIPTNTYTGDYEVSTYNPTDGVLRIPNGFHVQGITPPTITSVTPSSGSAGQTLDLTITGNATHFDQGSGTLLDFAFNQGSGTTVVNSITASSPTTLVANITIPTNTYTGDYDVSTYNSTDGMVRLPNGFHVQGITPPTITSVTPNSGNAGETLSLTITGSDTHFDQGSGTMLNFGFIQGSGTTIINSISATSPTSLVANITIPNNIATGGYYIELENTIDGSIFLDNGFYVTGNSNIIGHVIPTSESLNGLCDGKAKVVVRGGVPPYSYKYSNGEENSNVTDLCPGVYSLSVIDATSDTLNLNFIISSETNTFITSTYNDSTVIDSSYTSILSNCMIDFNLISSISITNMQFLPNNKVDVTWTVIYDGNSLDLKSSYNVSGTSGVYLLSLQIHCPHKSINQNLTAYDKIYYNAALVGIQEIETANFEIYPNPFDNYILISLGNNDTNSSEVLITDITGKVVVNRTYNEKSIKIDMTELSSGSYIVKVKNNNVVSTKQVIKY